MSSSAPLDKKPRLSSITFDDGSTLNSSNYIDNDFRFKKKLRVDSDATFKKNLEIDGNLTVNGDTNIVLQGYVTNSELTTAISNYETSTDKSRYLVAYAPNTYNSNSYPITGLSNNSSLLINTTNKFYLKSGAVIGKYLKCVNSEGEASWGDIESTTSTITDVVTQYGPVTNTQTQYSFKIVDTGTTGLSTERGVYFYPNILSDYVTNAGTAWQQQSIVLAIGTGNKNYIQTNDSSIPRIYVCPFGKGAEALFFKPPKSDDSSSGVTRLSGGSALETDQYISLEKEGVKIKIKNETNAQNKILTSSSFDGVLKFTDSPKIKQIINPNTVNSYILFETNGNINIKPSSNTDAETRKPGNVLSIDSYGNIQWQTPTQYSIPASLFSPVSATILTDSKNQSTYRSISTSMNLTAGTYFFTYNVCLSANNTSKRFELVRIFLSTQYDGDATTILNGTKETRWGSVNTTYSSDNPDYIHIYNSSTVKIIENGGTLGVDDSVLMLPPATPSINVYLNIFVRTSNTSSKEYTINGDYSHLTYIKLK